MRAMIVLFVLALASAGSFAGEGDTAVCKLFVDRNDTCREAVLEVCNTALKAKMLEQIEASPAGFQEEMRQDLDGKVQGFCNSFIAQATGEQALGMCQGKLGGTDPGSIEQIKKMKICLAKETCREYAECAVRFE